MSGLFWRLCLLLFLSLGLFSPAQAARLTVVLSDDSAPYQEVYQALRAHLSTHGHEIHQVYADTLAQVQWGDTRWVVTVGVRASDVYAATASRAAVLAVLVPRDWYLKSGRERLADEGRRNVSAVFLDQPFARQARLIRAAFPEFKRVGVLLGAGQDKLIDELATALRGQRLTLIHETAAPGARQIAPLEALLSEVDVLLALPDPLVFNRNTAQSIFLTSYRYRDPVLGYSRSLTRAGALLSLHSSPAQLGRQAAEMLEQVLPSPQNRLPAAAYPQYFNVSVNKQVSRSLGFAIPSETELEARLEGAE